MARTDRDQGDGRPTSSSQRVDRWLWFVRVVKSRTLAAGLVSDGRVRLNREKIARPSQPVRVGDVLTITIGPRLRILKVVGLGERRGPPSEAQTLYEDLSPPTKQPHSAAPAAGERDAGLGRPTKRDRRLLDKLKGEN
jgi:ribosome-associated heat shock protein Hsp15